MKKLLILTIYLIIVYTFQLNVSAYDYNCNFEQNGWSNPIGGTMKSSEYGNFKSQSYLNTLGVQHAGTDLWSGNYSEPVYAIADGNVYYIAKDNSINNNESVIYITHKTNNENNFTAVYGHTYAIVDYGPVLKGQLIGYTKNWSIYHLHFGINIESNIPTSSWGRTPSNIDPVDIGWRDPGKFLMQNYPNNSDSTSHSGEIIDSNGNMIIGENSNVNDYVSRHDTKYYTFFADSNQTYIVTLTPIDKDVDLYIGTQSSRRSSTNIDSITITGASSYRIKVYGYMSSNYNLTVRQIISNSDSTSHSGEIIDSSGNMIVDENSNVNDYVSRHDTKYYTFFADSNQTYIVTLTPIDKDVDLYIGTQSSRRSSTNIDSITITGASSYRIKVYGYMSSNYNLTIRQI